MSASLFFSKVITMDDTQAALKARHPDLHPLIFQRSLDKAKTNGELFDILDGLPKEYPIIWDENDRCWKHTTDLLQTNLLKAFSRQQP